MWLEILWRVARPFCTGYAFLRYGSVWGMRDALHSAPDGHSIIARVYKERLAQKGAWIGYRARIDGTPTFPHGVFGVFISDHAVIGKNCVIFQHVTIGGEIQPDSVFQGSPIIGDNVYIGAGAKLIGGIRIGANCRIGANATINGNLLDNTLAVCAPPRKLRITTLDRQRIDRGKAYR